MPHALRLYLALCFALLIGCGEESHPQDQTSPPSGGGGGQPAEGSTIPEGQLPPRGDGTAPGLDRSIFPLEGETEFTTANENELLSNGVNGYTGQNARGALDDGDFAEADGAGAADPNAPPSQPAEEATPDPSREIVEADVYKLDGDLLYVLNRFRGLAIIDVSNPAELRVVGRLPFQAMPIEMYVRDGRAYIVMSDHFVYWQYDPDADPHGFHGSQVMIADVSDPTNPHRLGGLHVEGEVTDTRLVGDVLYAVSKRRADYWRYNTADWEDRTLIVSMNIADPEDIREMDRVTFSGTSTLIHVAHHAIFVAAWDPNYYLYDGLNEQETLVTYVDISDAQGALETRGHVYIPGQIADKFKMDWYEGTLRVISQRWQGDDNITLHVIDTNHPDALEIDAQLELDGVTRSGLRATRFEGTRAFAMTSYYEHRNNNNYRVRELHSVDLSDAHQPRHATRARIELDITHFEIHDDRLLALGSNYERWSDRRVVMALYDISNLDHPEELALERLGDGNSSSDANNDYKALKVFRDMNLILIPLNYWVYDGDRHHSFQGVQLVDWRGDTLVERGRAPNAGGVRRAFPVNDTQIIAVGEQAISTINIQDRDAPQVEGVLHLIHQVHDIYDIQGLQVQLVTDIYSNNVEVQVREFAKEDNESLIARVELPYHYAPTAYRDGDALHLIGYEADDGQTIRNVDLSNPRQPALRGRLVLTNDFERIYNNGQSFYARYWSPYAGLPLRNQILPATFRTIVEDETGRRDFHSELRFIDLRDLDEPRIAEGAVPMNDFPFVNKVTHGEILYSTHVEQATTEAGESLLYHVRSYVDRVDVSNPDAPQRLPSVNVPGYLVDVSEDGQIWFTVDFQWDDFGRRRNSLNVLKQLSDERVALVTVIPVPDQIDRAAYRPSAEGARSIWIAAHKYPWWGVRSDTVASRQPYTVLQNLNIDDDGRLTGQTQATLAGYHFDLLDVEGARAYLASTGPWGLLVLDVSNPASPSVRYAARTIGYLSRIVLHGLHAYTPMGWYGVHRYQVDQAAPR
ncbi:beta-propeller domain-containing protein [Myxococcota bacterium]|nr:beta-propeller domain-containing protein [Myxococcota bacterium]